MPFLSFLLNVLWIVFGGFYMAAGWLIAGVLMAITIVGLPWCFAAFRIARYTLLPFGQTVVSREEAEGSSGGPLALVGNLIWLVLAGWWLAIGHLVTAAALAISIVGIPFAWAHLKLAGLALWPLDRVVVTAEEAAQLRGYAGRPGA
jgi:uncharacterized membrane protein YccF (DUF307 family)